MKLEDIQAEIEKDSIIDKNKLDTESLKIPQMHAKYYRYFMDEVKILKGVEFKFREMKKEKTQYYLGQGTDDKYKEKPLGLKVLKQDIDLYLDADPELNELRARYELQKAKVDMLEGFIKTLNTRNFLIKNAIEWQRFQQGM